MSGEIATGSPKGKVGSLHSQSSADDDPLISLALLVPGSD
jgi:hypothetical protein